MSDKIPVADELANLRVVHVACNGSPGPAEPAQDSPVEVPAANRTALMPREFAEMFEVIWRLGGDRSTPPLGVLPALAYLLPRRIYEEEVCDALELLHRLHAEGAPRWTLRLKVASTCFWVLINSIRFFVSGLKGGKKV